MQKLLVCFLGFLAVSAAVPVTYRLKNIFVNEDGTSIVVMAKDGKAIHILTNKTDSQGQGQGQTSGQQKIEIQVTGPYEKTKTVRIEDYKGEDGKLESLTIAEIFHGFQGTVDTTNYEKLMDTIEKHVQDKKIHPNILYALQFLDMEKYDMKNNIFYKMKMQDIMRDQMTSGMETGMGMDTDMGMGMMEQARKHFGYSQDMPEYNYKDTMMRGQYPQQFQQHQDKAMMMGKQYPYFQQQQFKDTMYPHSQQHQYMGMDYPYASMDDQFMTLGKNKGMMMTKEGHAKDMYDIMGQNSYLPHSYSGHHMTQDSQMGDYYNMMRGSDRYDSQKSDLRKMLFGYPDDSEEQMYSRYGNNMLMNKMEHPYSKSKMYSEQMPYQDLAMAERLMMQKPQQYYNGHLSHGLNDYMSQGMTDSYLNNYRMMRDAPGSKSYMKSHNVDDSVAY